LPEPLPLPVRTQLLGLMLGLFPLLQILSAPILGGLSDRWGRKNILLVSLAGTFIGHVLFGVGLVTSQLWMLFLGRAISGLTGGNISVAMSAIADVSNESERTKHFGLIGMAYGLGFIIGPWIGGRLADPNVLWWFGPDTPFWFSALLTGFNIGWLALVFRETLTIKTRVKMTFLTGATYLLKAFTLPNLRILFLVSFLVTIGFNFFTQFIQVYLIERFHATPSQIGDLFGFAGVWTAFTQGILMRLIANHWSATRVLSVSSLCSAGAFLLLLIPWNLPGMFAVVPAIAVFSGLAIPNLTTVVSNHAGNSSLGETIGINQSVISLAQALPPILAGSIAGYDARIPIIFASVFTLLGWLAFVTIFQTKNRRSKQA